MNKIYILPVVALAGQLSSCTMAPETSYADYQAYNYGNTQYYTQSYGGVDYGDYGPQATHEVTIPDSYYAGNHSPASPKDQDRNWVSGQNPQGYTIEIANDPKASAVAGKLLKAPKSDRTAEVKYYQNGQVYYKGLYGTYNSQEEAQKALNSLPQDVKQGAGIKNWGTIQGTMGE